MNAHPYAELFPMMADDELRELADDIKLNGQRDDIVTFDGMILDGRNRYKACEIAGVEPMTRGYLGDNPKAFVLSANLHRRHLTESQRAMVATRLAKLTAGDNQHENKGKEVVGIPTTSQSEAAKDLGVSRDSVIQARKVVESGTPELVAAVDAGTVSVNAAATVAKLPKDEQEKIVAKGPDAVKKAAAKARKKKQPKEETATTDKPTPTIATPAVDDIEATGKPPTHDALGIPIQPEHIEIFAQVPEFKALVRALKKAQKFYHKLASGPAGAFLIKRSQFVNRGDKREDGRWKNSHFEELIKTIEDCTPTHTACPYAHNPKAPHTQGERPCGSCLNTGWAPPLMLNQIPASIIAATKAAFGVEDAA